MKPVVRLLRWSERYTKTDMVSLAGHGAWFNLGAAVLSLCALLLYIVFANVLTKEAFGTYQYLLASGALIGAFTLTGMNTAVARAVAQGYEGTLRRAVRIQLLYGLAPLLLSLGIAGYYFVQDNLVLAGGFVAIALFAPLLNAFNTYGAYFHGRQDFKRGTMYGLIWHLPYYAALVLVAFVSGEALLLVVTNLLVQAVATAFIYLHVQNHHVQNDAHDPEALSYGKHLSIMNLPGVVAAQIDSILAFHFLGAAALAVYAFATAIPERLTGFLKFLPTIALPRLSAKSPDSIREMLSSSRMWLVLLLVVVCVLGYIVCVPFVFALLFPEYAQAVPFSQFYALIFIGVIGNLFVAGLTAERSTKELYIFNVLSPVGQLALQFVGIITFGLWGLIVGRVVAVFVSLILAAILLFGKREREQTSAMAHDHEDAVENAE